MTQRTILIVAPHPDDETLGCGGVIARCAEEGGRVMVVVVTDGRHLFRLSRWKIETNPTAEEAAAMRKAETQRALDILAGDAATVRFLNVEDGTLSEHVPSVADSLAGIIREAEPEEIYVTSEYEEHADHVAACMAVREAMRKAQSHARLNRYTIFLREGLLPQDIPEPLLGVDITGQLEVKRRAAGQFKSHLTIAGEGQTEPFFENVDPWVQSLEVFYIDKE